MTEDRRKLCVMMLSKACDDLPDYTFGEILYTVSRRLARRFGASAGYFKVVSDDEILAEIDDAVLSEKEK